MGAMPELEATLEILGRSWEIVGAVGSLLFYVFGATGVTWHAITKKRESHTTTAWVALAWMAPVFGSLAYLALGINRIERHGAARAVREARRKALAQSPFPAAAEVVDHAQEHPSLRGLAEAAKRISGRGLTGPNEVAVLEHGDEAYPAMIEAIEGAERYVFLLSYIFDNDRAGEAFFQALVAAKDRGVVVRVLVDGVGAGYSPSPTMVERLRKAGVKTEAFLETGRLAMFRYANLRNHRKVLVVDGKTAFTGGTNIREGHWLSLKPSDPIQCLHFAFRGGIVAHLLEVFLVDWAFVTQERLDKLSVFDDEAMTEERCVDTQPLGLPRSCGGVLARGISDGPDEDLGKMADVLMSALASARDRVLIVTPYFLPDRELLGAIGNAALRGVQVDIVIPEKNNVRVMDWATMPVLPLLLRKGCRVHLSAAPFDHTKVLVVDDRWSLVGSTNWDARSLRLNFEYNVECYSERLGETLASLIALKVEAAKPLTLAELDGLSPWVRFRNGVAHLGAPYL